MYVSGPPKSPFQQHLLSQLRPQQPETFHQVQDPLLTPREQFATLQQNPPLTPRELFAKFYGFALPPLLPQQEDPDAQFRRSQSSRAASSALTYPSPLNHDDLLAIFNGQLVHSKTYPSTPTPRAQRSPTKRERSILPPGAEGKLLVPNVKLKARCQCASTPSTRSPSRKTLPRIQDTDQCVLILLTLGQPKFKTRPWSYDGMQTYPVLELPPKKQTRILKKNVDGEEGEVKTEIDERPKKLFLFAPKVVLMN